MTKFKGILAVKVVAIFLSVVILLCTGFFAFCVLVAGVTGAYTGEFGKFKDDAMGAVLRSYAYDVGNSYFYGEDIERAYGEYNFYYTIVSGEQEISNFNELRCPYMQTETVTVESHAYSVVVNSLGTKIQQRGLATVTLYEKTDANKTTSDMLSLFRFWLDTIYSLRYLSIIFALSGLVLFIIVMIFIFCSAGYRNGSDRPLKNHFDRIPFDICTALCAGVVVGISAIGLMLIEEILFLSRGTITQDASIAIACVVGVVAVCTVDYLVLLGYAMSLATRLKVGGIIRETVIYKAASFVGRVIAKVFGAIFSLICSIPFVWKTVLAVSVISGAELVLFVINFHEADNLIILWIAEKMLIIPLVIWIAVMLKKLKKSGEAIASGRMDEKVDTKYMPLEFGEFGDTLNNIGEGLGHALEERMKSERLKTELITNVSHDIKTPLTSIVNYVDLIQKEEIENEKIGEYVDVIARHSARLKKLIEDLVEASKASTGNISVNPERCDVGVLLEQSLGEYAERLEAAKLTTVIEQPETSVFIMADGRRLWRVFDNLLTNICKYAMPATRVYISLKREDGKAVITFRNISREELKQTGEELTERFVRGDKSRNTEGSGLGLSIARSLTELQGGVLALAVDGDLFKAMITFDEIE